MSNTRGWSSLIGNNNQNSSSGNNNGWGSSGGSGNAQTTQHRNYGTTSDDANQEITVSTQTFFGSYYNQQLDQERQRANRRRHVDPICCKIV